MNDEKSFGPLEERLADEAQRMLAAGAGTPPFPALRTEFLRRRGQRRIVRTVVAAAALIAIALLLRGGKNQLEEPGPPMANVGGFPAEGHRPDVSANAVRDGASENETVISDTESPGEQRRPPGSLVILIAHMGENGETEYLPGWYVPEQVEVVDSAELSPAERAAAARLLGADFNNSSDETI